MTTAEQRPLYGIGTVARMAGIKQDTLRIWERRYGLGASQKADNGRRLYTQNDLEHLQIVSQLVDSGFRIGEIASMERKTMTAMLERTTGSFKVPAPRPRLLFLGTSLCDWLDRHPGCLSGLDSSLLKTSLDELVLDDGLNAGETQLLAVEAPALGNEQADKILELHQKSGAVAGLVFYEFANQQSLAKLTDAGLGVARLPMDTDMFAANIRRLVSSLEVERGNNNTGELTSPQQRIFKDSELQQIMKQESGLECGCMHHISAIIQSLVNFEQYSTQCSVENWNDAATHTCVYAYTNQARWLMEKALSSVLEEHQTCEKGAKP